MNPAKDETQPTQAPQSADLGFVLEQLGRQPPPSADPQYLAGFAAAWQAAHEIHEWLWWERLGLAESDRGDAPAGSPGPTRLDPGDALAVSSSVASQLRAIAATLRRSAHIVAGLATTTRETNAAQAISDTAVTVGVSAEALDHLVAGHLKALPPWQDPGEDDKWVVDPWHEPLAAWAAAYALASAIARQPTDEVLPTLLTVARHDPMVLAGARRRLSDLDARSVEARVRADAVLLVAVDRATRWPRRRAEPDAQ